MENKEIQKLLDFIAQSTLDEVNIETSELKLSVKRYGQAPVVQQVVAAPAPVAVAAAPVAAAPAAPATPAAAPAVASNRVTIKSPMIGTFYRSSSPDTPSFVEIGSEVSKGKPVCIIEAMKLFNEIESEVSGRIVEVLVENATPVEFDQPLFVVEQ
ncbi:acetyl-CoA carboxylase biotin carboxyl carrier protein [Flectobacillus longus]|uniref:Biotin carboxyl carrier protein of acetyl-CoA carboxylase n=1 Tax=Flectobacillus longus TaxID=2984207 RepID=A0ABT6YMB4_9BACT|nr:acetyl-CoA carboxylase biotin carboxyl carrier protein [Flectobacillus longus]MDI9864737.1 acetyl-CoA carboxylase biotin carboxyl carrier protein [Flectobacillus longus]MDI9880374.1 acetyl-CoA carboxylase biotin carboxyl carrier protein [Flectobacillus longus]